MPKTQTYGRQSTIETNESQELDLKEARKGLPSRYNPEDSSRLVSIRPEQIRILENVDMTSSSNVTVTQRDPNTKTNILLSG